MKTRLFFYAMAALIMGLLFKDSELAIFTAIFAVCCIILIAAYLALAFCIKVCKTRENDLNPFN
jgi:uncharacterized membrane protein YeiB